MKYTDESSTNQEEEDDKTYTVEEAVEAIGFGRFQLIVYFVGGIITVSLFTGLWDIFLALFFDIVSLASLADELSVHQHGDCLLQ